MFRSFFRRRRRGFSLMELLLVVTIIGIIAAIVVPRVMAPTDTARAKVRASHIAMLNGMIERHHIETGTWPTAIGDLSANLPDGPPVDPSGGSYAIDDATHRITYTAP